MRAEEFVGLSILYPFNEIPRQHSTVGGGTQKLVQCQAEADGPVSGFAVSDRDRHQADSDLSNAAPNACERL